MHLIHFHYIKWPTSHCTTQTDHRCCCCVSVCQLDKWPVRLAVMYPLPSSAHLPLPSDLCRLFLCLPPIPWFYHPPPPLPMCPERSNLSIHGISAAHTSGCSHFGSRCVLAIILATSRPSARLQPCLAPPRAPFPLCTDMFNVLPSLSVTYQFQTIAPSPI